MNTLFSHTHCPIYTLIYTLSLTKSGYLVELPELSEPAHRSFIRGILQIRVLAVVIWSLFILAVTGLGVLVTQPFIVSSPFLVESRNLRWALSVR